jgi:hypothetical protein
MAMARESHRRDHPHEMLTLPALPVEQGALAPMLAAATHRGPA